jgi:hypothetical protein
MPEWQRTGARVQMAKAERIVEVLFGIVEAVRTRGLRLKGPARSQSREPRRRRVPA